MHHFTRLPGGRSPEAARKSLSALAAREALTGISPWPALSANQMQAVAGVAIGYANSRNVIVSATVDGYVQIWRPPFRDPARTLWTWSDGVTSVTAGRAGDVDIIVAGSADGTVHAWDAATGWEAAFFPARHGDSPVYAVALGRAANRDVIVSCSADGTAQARDVVTGDAVLLLPASQRSPDGSWRPALRSVAIGQAGNQDIIVTGCEDGIVRVWDARTGDLICTPLACHDDFVSGVAIGRAGNRTIIVSCSADRSVVAHEYRARPSGPKLADR